MTRWLTHLTIVAYLATLGWGVLAHTGQVGLSSHPGMYYIVWDMFCGWASYANRVHIVGEGASGRFYRLAPPPWGSMEPFGTIGRRNYDSYYNFVGRMATNVLEHTRHEPITRIFVVQENWPKKFNIPDDVWARRFSYPKNVQRYYNVKSILTADGVPLETNPTWLSQQMYRAITDNPRLARDARRGRPFYAVNPNRPKVGGRQSDRFSGSDARSRVGSPLGN